jgi:hypothetical protein
VLPAHRDHFFGGTPSAFAIRRIGWLKETSALHGARASNAAAGCRRHLWSALNAVFLQQVLRELAMLRGNARFRLSGDVLLARGRDVFGDQHVGTIGLAVDVVVDPFQLLLDRLGECDVAPSTPKPPARLTGDDIAAMAESNRKLDSSMSQIGDFMVVFSLRQLWAAHS